jgi:hypothetical protein
VSVDRDNKKEEGDSAWDLRLIGIDLGYSTYYGCRLSQIFSHQTILTSQEGNMHNQSETGVKLKRVAKY